MTKNDIIKAINKLADDAVRNMNKNIPAVQRRLLIEVENEVRKLEYTGNKISVSVANMRAINAIGNKLRRLILGTGYQENVAEFIKSFSGITTLQNQYLRLTLKNFKIKGVLKQLKEQSVNATIQALTEQGIEANVIEPIRQALRTNITNGGTFNDLMSQVRETIVKTSAGKGALERYVKQITTDALNQYSRNYLQTATLGSSLEWYQYTGSNIITSRCFCLAMTAKRYFHVSEIPKLIAGDFDEFRELQCEIEDSTDLPSGMIPGTNVANFLTNLGGYNCGHRAIPVLDITVPISIRQALNK